MVWTLVRECRGRAALLIKRVTTRSKKATRNTFQCGTAILSCRAVVMSLALCSRWRYSRRRCCWCSRSWKRITKFPSDGSVGGIAPDGLIVVWVPAIVVIPNPRAWVVNKVHAMLVRSLGSPALALFATLGPGLAASISIIVGT
jgi:hypothetical protein